ncbi:MAG: toll/interleukin-1 receptor domain-containing protein, partial [Planctomycetota bacterium]|nr:toll/interleukin-1 receptor domain-containing protein [Planctomycetota bacterium]
MSNKTYFVSYTTRTPSDIAWAKWVSWVLENKLNAKTIIQAYDFRAGDNFRERMNDALRRADAVVCVLTRAYLESANCTDEWTNAPRIIPVRFEDFTPTGVLTSRVYIDLCGLDKDSARDALISVLQGKQRPIEEPSAPFPASAKPEPDFPATTTENIGTARNYLPIRNRYFIGRDDMLSKIYTRLKSSPVVSVIGAGGFGKTETAIEYAYLHMSEYNLIWRFNAESENQLQNDYREFAIRNLSINNATELNFPSIKRMFDNWCANHSAYLLIYDNAENCPDLKSYLPTGQWQGHILINSREKLSGIVSERLTAELFSPEDAVEFIQRRIPDADADSAKNLADTLGYLPLALECAVAYTNESQYTIKEYLDLYKKHSIRVLDSKSELTDYQYTVLTVWSATFDKISKEAESDETTKAALQLFKLCTYCAADNIPLPFFIDGRAETPQPLSNSLAPDNEPLHNDIIEKLKRYSLVSMHRVEGKALLSVHKLIQEVANFGFEHTEWVNCCLEIAVAVFNYQYGTREEFDKFAANLPHIIKIAQHTEVFLTDDDSKTSVARLYNEIGTGLRYQGDYTKSLTWYYKALAIYEKVFGTEHPLTATTYNNIATDYQYQGAYVKALEWYYTVLAIREKWLGKEHPDTATTYNNIALVYHNQGDYAKALEWNYKA